MNETFETIRKSLKKYNAEENEAPHKLIIADKNDFLNLETRKKKNSQFIIAIKEFIAPEKHLMEELLTQLEAKTGKPPIVFLYDDREVISTVIDDFQDFYNVTLSKDIFQKIGSVRKQPDAKFSLIIVPIESFYYT